jgi:hypothetical protein
VSQTGNPIERHTGILKAVKVQFVNEIQICSVSDLGTVCREIRTMTGEKVHQTGLSNISINKLIV